MKKSTLIVRGALWLVIAAAVVFLMWALASVTGSDGSNYTEPDYGMNTRRWVTEVEVHEDASLAYREEIQVELDSGKHGILRYVPDRGAVEGTAADGSYYRMPYMADISLTSCSDPVEDYRENGNTVFRIGDPYDSSGGLRTYELSYTLSPTVQDADYSVVYLNLFPNEWANTIPAGSQFTVHFPREVSLENLKLYAGAYGESLDGSQWCTFSSEGTELYGTLTRDLEIGQCLTMYLPVEEGFYTDLRLFDIYQVGGIFLSVLALGICLVLFLFFGRNDPVIPSIQYTPPDGLDSAAVGYIVDGKAENRDLISLLIYWADQGFLTIQDSKTGNLTLKRTKRAFEGQEKYASVLFNKIFKKGEKVTASSLTHKCADTMDAVREELKDSIKAKGGVYTSASRISQVAAWALSLMPLGILLLAMIDICLLPDLMFLANGAGALMILAGGWFLAGAVDSWYSENEKKRTALAVRAAGLILTGIALVFSAGWFHMEARQIPDFRMALMVACLVTVICLVLAAFMKKRTKQCTEWMGRIVGLRDFIETAELDRLKVLAGDHPEWFYHILPYTYVFGLTEIFAERLKDIALPAPGWYTTTDPTMMGWNYAMCSRRMTRSMEKTAVNWTTPPPSSSGSSGSGKGSSGGFGGFSGGGGGFSGGGFGGGGGRSW